MATVKIDLSLEDTKGSIKSRKSEVESLNRELEKTKRLSTGTKSGSGAVKSSYSSAMGGSENAEYGRARGSMGATGAGARDFANQAQGLGGLVRLYATWAANIFAVSAAFSALSNAANVTNMIQGMNQLGISSGIALGSMAQRFVEASDGAISLKDAVSATVKAVSSGLSQAQFEQLGKVANNASKALGIDMADAVSRLTRGITKLEPELLDELGIFTKVGAATEDYAKRIGKSAASLTDFEKRQAFANAVLAEGTAKFGSIKIEANPYDQLAASLTNLSNKVLGFINTALGPLISLLSSSPTALGIVVAGLGSLLLKQAIPAIGQYKSALASSADESEKKWQQKSDAIKKIEKDQFQYIINMSEAEADAKLASFEKAERRLKKSKGMAGVFDERTQNILQGTTLSKEDRGYLQSKQAEAAAAGNKQLAAAYKEARVALDGWIKSEKEHEKLLEKISDQTNKNISGASKLSAAGFARDELNKARISKSRSALISEAAENASTGSMSQSWEKLNKGIKDEKLTGISAGFTRVGGAAAIATTAISRAASVVTGFFGTVGLVVGALSTLYSFMSKNRKEAEALGSAIEQSDEAVKTATGTFEKFNNVLSSESIMAKANATVGLVDAMDKLVNKFADFDKASNGVDMVWESLKSLVGLSKQDDVAKGLASSITKLLETIEDPALKSEFEGKLKNLLSIDDLNFFAIDDALDSIDPKKLKQLTKDAEELKVKNQAVASSVALIRDGFKNVTTAFTALENTLKPNDVVSNYASAIAKQSDIMTKAFENPKVAAATFNDIIADTSKLQAFSPESAAQILAVAEDFKRLTKAIQDAELQLKSLSGASYWEDIDTQAYDSLQRDAIFVKLQADKKSLAELGNVLKKATADSMEYAFKIALAKVKTASAQAGIDQQKGLVSALPKSQATIEAQMTLENKSIDIRKQEIQSIYTLTNQLKISTASQKVMDLEKKLQNATPEKQAEISKELGLAQAEEQIYRGTLAKENVPAELKGAYFEQQQLRSGMQSQLAVLDINKISNEQKRALDKKLALFEQDNRNDADYIKEKEVQRDAQLAQEGLTLEDRDTINKQFRLVTEAERKRQATIAERQTVSQAKGVIDIVTKPAVNGISGAAAQAGQEALTAARTDLPTYEKQTKDAEARFAILEATTDTQAKSALLVETTARDYDRISQILSDNNAASTLEYDTRVQSLDIDQKSLDTKLAQKTISQQQYEDQTNLNELKRVELNTAQQLNQALSDYINKTVALNKEIAAGNVTPQRSAQIETDKANALKFYTDSTQRIREQGTADKERLNILGELSVRQKAYADIFENSMKGMEDAIVEFTKTGKLSFESMISSFIEGLLRYEIQQAQMSFIRGSGGFGGILNAGFNYFATMGDTNAAGNAMFDAGLNMMAPSAKGNAFDYGIEAFAKGGAFTNSIVNSPTLFKFAKGTGLMGEAGPEAIMPLTRDGSGNLGVRAQGGGSNVEVVINNYSTEKAETKETVDSKGNRKIEVMVGDMVADQLSKPGSSTQQALTNGFGQRPSIVRR